VVWSVRSDPPRFYFNVKLAFGDASTLGNELAVLSKDNHLCALPIPKFRFSDAEMAG
jgi:hypothetical protein